MLIKGRASPRTSSRVDAPGPNPSRPCRPPPPEEILSFDDDVVFEWSKSIAPEFDPRKYRVRTQEHRRSNDGLFPGLFSEVIDDSLSQRPTTTGSLSSLGSLLASSSRLEQSNAEDVSSRTTTRCESTKLYNGIRTSVPNRCHTAPPSKINEDDENSMNATNVIDIVTEHEIKTRERSKSCRLYGETNKRGTGFPKSKSAPKFRKPNEERYLIKRFRERPCSRAESYVKEDLFETTSNLSRECCDILGPRHCYDCYKITQRNTFMDRNISEFPSIHMTPKNMSTITLVQRLFPELSTLDILEGVADGYISSRSFSRDRLLELCERKKADARRKELREKWKGAAKRQISAFSVPDKLFFFSNFTDLRAQILKQRGSYTGMKDLVSQVSHLQQMPPPTEIELIIKKEQDRENPANYFCPPLMSREEIQRQRSQPRFYAGTKQEYKLPDAPPDPIQTTNKKVLDLDNEAVTKPTRERTKPSSPRVSAFAGPMRKARKGCTFGSSGGMFGKAPGRSRPPLFGRPEIGGGGLAKSPIPPSSFSRPLQMETLAEDGNQSEKESTMDDEEEGEGGEEEEEDNDDEDAEVIGSRTNTHNSFGHNHRQRKLKSIEMRNSSIGERDEEEEEEEEGEETKDDDFIESDTRLARLQSEEFEDCPEHSDQENQVLADITSNTRKLQLTSNNLSIKKTEKHAFHDEEDTPVTTGDSPFDGLMEEVEEENDFALDPVDAFSQSESDFEQCE